MTGFFRARGGEVVMGRAEEACYTVRCFFSLLASSWNLLIPFIALGDGEEMGDGNGKCNSGSYLFFF